MTKVEFFAKLTNHQFRSNSGARQEGWRVMEVKKEKREGFLADVKPSAEDLPEEQKSSEFDLGQGRKFVRPLAALYRQVMAEEDAEEDTEENPQSDNQSKSSGGQAPFGG